MILDYIQIIRRNFFNTLESIFLPITVGKTPYEVVDKHLNFKLFRYTKDNSEKRVLLISPNIINRPYILDLNDDVSVVRKFIGSGFAVYLIDWGYPTIEQAKISLSDYVKYLERAADLICRERGIQKVSVLGYCTGGLILLMYGSLNPDKLERLILLATPVDFSGNDPRILWGKIFNTRGIVSFFGNFPGEFITIFGRNLFMSYLPFFSMNAEFYKEFLTFESWRDVLRINRWLIDTPMIPGSTFVQFIEDCYQHNLIINNKMKIDSRIIDLKKITCPLLNIMAKYDHVVPLSSGKALKNVYSGDYEEIVFPSSHIGLSVNKKAHLDLWPKVCEWLAD